MIDLSLGPHVTEMLKCFMYVSGTCCIVKLANYIWHSSIPMLRNLDFWALWEDSLIVHNEGERSGAMYACIDCLSTRRREEEEEEKPPGPRLSLN